eukprot:4928548-Prymnesium_polylepis.1
MVVGNLLASKCVIASMPHSPLSSEFQKSSPLPSAETTPRPVTTIFGSPAAISADGRRVPSCARRSGSRSGRNASEPAASSMVGEIESCGARGLLTA